MSFGKTEAPVYERRRVHTFDVATGNEARKRLLAARQERRRRQRQEEVKQREKQVEEEKRKEQEDQERRESEVSQRLALAAITPIREVSKIKLP